MFRCGACQDGLSETLGSGGCKDCSSISGLFFLTIFILLIIVICLVFFLLVQAQNLFSVGEITKSDQRYFAILLMKNLRLVIPEHTIHRSQFRARAVRCFNESMLFAWQNKLVKMRRKKKQSKKKAKTKEHDKKLIWEGFEPSLCALS